MSCRGLAAAALEALLQLQCIRVCRQREVAILMNKAGSELSEHFAPPRLEPSSRRQPCWTSPVRGGGGGGGGGGGLAVGAAAAAVTGGENGRAATGIPP